MVAAVAVAGRTAVNGGGLTITAACPGVERIHLPIRTAPEKNRLARVFPKDFR
jgi:hypothetical protein